MAVQPNSDQGRILRKLIPLASFPIDAFNELCTNIRVEQIQDQAIFKRGDTDTDLVYLLNGSVTLQSGGLIVDVIDADCESAKFALAHQIPRKIDAIANGVAQIVRLDADTVNNPPPAVYDEDQGYTIIEELSEDSDDWMTALLRLPLFQELSPNNLQKILISLKTASYAEGETILSEGDPVDYFYLINKGHCQLARRLPGGVQTLKLNAGDSFGEEYLVVDSPSQETVTAMTDVGLIQLEKKLFLSQILAPLVKFIAHEEMPDALAKGAVLLDVRQPQYYVKQNIAGSANIPLPALRTRLAEIPKDRPVIVVCANGLESQAAAFLLTKNRFNALVLKGGMGIEPDDDEEPASEFLEPTEPNQAQTPAVTPIIEAVSNTASASADNEQERLTVENERLAQRNSELESIISRLQAEKDQAEKQIQMLNQHMDRLKEILNRLTKSK